MQRSWHKMMLFQMTVTCSDFEMVLLNCHRKKNGEAISYFLLCRLA
uniref:Uncharacterized protein n=1 Tax=Anguilla anguilla TaxID=7936 RepID=A0A0E9T6Q5_ANGAN